MFRLRGRQPRRLPRRHLVPVPAQTSPAPPVNPAQRAVICLASVLAAAAAACAVTVVGAPEWLAAAVTAFTLAVVSGPLWTPPFRRTRR